MKQYNIVIKGNDGFEFSNITEQQTFISAIVEANALLKALEDRTIEQLCVFSIEELP